MRDFFRLSILSLAVVLFVACTPGNLSRNFNIPVFPNVSSPVSNDLMPGLSATPEKSDGWWEIYFTDPGQDDRVKNNPMMIEERLIGLIGQAGSSIDMAVYSLSLPRVAEALINARQRGVQVRWIIDQGELIQGDSEERELVLHIQENGIQIKSPQVKGLMHHKFLILDRQWVWTGSTNLTRQDLYNYDNNIILLQSPALAEIYTRQFDDMWEGIIGPNAPSDLGSQTTQINYTSIKVMFSPEDNGATELIRLVRSAKESIRFMAFSFTDNDLGNAMADQAEAGVSVSGIFESSGSELSSSEFANLYCVGLDVRKDGNPDLFHHKVIIVDGRYLVTGSFNFSTSANQANSENLLIIDHPGMAKRYLDEFSRRWAESVKPEPGAVICPSGADG